MNATAEQMTELRTAAEVVWENPTRVEVVNLDGVWQGMCLTEPGAVLRGRLPRFDAAFPAAWERLRAAAVAIAPRGGMIQL